jgi:hypothetical protein
MQAENEKAEFKLGHYLYFDDHNHPPHFHAIYRGDEAQVGIDPIIVS